MTLTDSPELFDFQEAQRRKEHGMDRAAANKSVALAFAQGFAVSYALRTGSCNADIVQEHLLDIGLHLGNAAGSIFRGKHWKCTGWIKSNRITNHARFIRQWEYLA